MISWLSQTTLLKLPGPADLLYATPRRSGPVFRYTLHNSLFKLLICPVWTIAMLSWQAGLPASSIKLLQLIQNAVARLIFNEPKRMHVTPLFINLQQLPIAARIKLKGLPWCLGLKCVLRRQHFSVFGCSRQWQKQQLWVLWPTLAPPLR